MKIEIPEPHVIAEIEKMKYIEDKRVQPQIPLYVPDAKDIIKDEPSTEGIITIEMR